MGNTGSLSKGCMENGDPDSLGIQALSKQDHSGGLAIYASPGPRLYWIFGYAK